MRKSLIRKKNKTVFYPLLPLFKDSYNFQHRPLIYIVRKCLLWQGSSVNHYDWFDPMCRSVATALFWVARNSCKLPAVRIEYTTHTINAYRLTYRLVVVGDLFILLSGRPQLQSRWMQMSLKTLNTIGNCQRLVFTVGVSQHMHKITNLWKFVYLNTL